MKIQFQEMTIATKDVQKTKDFYLKLFKDEVKLDDFEFYYVLNDARNTGNVCVVPHNGDPKWDNPWLTVTTDDLPEAINYIKEIGVDPSTIENFGATHDNGDPKTGVTFRDPDGRLLMLLFAEEVES